MADERKPTGATPGPNPQRLVRPTPPGGPSGMDLNPKPEPTRRVSKRGGIIVMGVLLIIVTLIIYGIFTRGKGPLAKEPQTKAKRLGDATTSGDQMADNLLKQSKNRKGSDDTEPDPSDDLKAPPLSSRVRPGSRGGAPKQQTVAHVLSAAEQAREKAYKDEEDARNAPMSISGGSNGGGPLGGAHSPSNSLLDTLKNDASLASLLRGAGGAGGLGEAVPPLQDDPNKQNDNESFLEKTRAHPEAMYLKSSSVNPLTRYEIKAGWDIPATLEQAVNSDLPGEIKALVRSNVYDTASGRYLLIPQGSRLIGTYNHSVAYGQIAVQVIWTRLLYPDGTSINLQGMIGQDAQGQSGFRDEVDNHYARLLSFALLTSAFSAGIELSQNQQSSSFAYPSTSQSATQALGQQLGELGMETTRRNLNIQPTIKIRIGYRFNVRVNKDIAFEEPYSPIAN
jgi:type IV secretory pathway VirB10-like protein